MPYLNSGNAEFRSMVSATLEEVFRADKKGEVSHAIVKQVKHTWIFSNKRFTVLLGVTELYTYQEMFSGKLALQF